MFPREPGPSMGEGLDRHMADRGSDYCSDDDPRQIFHFLILPALDLFARLIMHVNCQAVHRPAGLLDQPEQLVIGREAFVVHPATARPLFSDAGNANKFSAANVPSLATGIAPADLRSDLN